MAFCDAGGKFVIQFNSICIVLSDKNEVIDRHFTKT